MKIIAINQNNIPLKNSFAQMKQSDVLCTFDAIPSFHAFFGGKKKESPRQSENPDYLTREEFAAEYKNLGKRIKSDKKLKDNNDIQTLKASLNRYNIKAFEAFIDKGLYNDKTDISLIKAIISDTVTPNNAVITNKIINDDKLRKNGYLLSIYRISMYEKNKNDEGNYEKFMERLFSDEDLYKNDCIMSSLDTIAYLILNKDTRKLAYNVILNKDFAKKYLSLNGKFTLSEDYIKNQHNLKITDDDNNMKIITFTMNDNQYDVLSEELISARPKYSDDLAVKKDKDGNTYISVVKYETVFNNFLPNKYPVTQKNTKYDMYGNRIYTEILQPQREHPWLYSGIMAKPHEKPLRAFDMKENLEKTDLSKKLISPEGIVTESYNNVDKINNTSEFSYKITSPDGKNLLSVERTFKKIDENQYESTLNDKKYSMEYTPDKLKIKLVDKDGSERVDTLNLKENFDENLETVYKKLPGDVLLNLMKSGTTLAYNYNSTSSGRYNDIANKITIFGDYIDKPFPLLHEAGHAYDIKIGKLSSNSDLREIFDEELLNYKQSSTTLEGEAIDYFTTLRHDNFDNCLTEVVAETYAIMSGEINNTDNDIKLRELVLSKNFPKTIAFIANKIIGNN